MSRSRSVPAALAILAATLLLPAAASAQSRIELTPFAGYYIASDIYNGYNYSVQGGNGTLELKNSFLYGGRITASARQGGIEFAYTRAGSDLRTERSFPGQTSGDIGRVNIDTYDFNFIGYQPSGNPRVTPFGLIGFGWSVTHPEIDAAFIDAIGSKAPEGNTLFNFNFGLGAKIEMNPKLSMRLEGRWRVTDTSITTSSGIWCDPFGYCYSYASDWYNSGELVGGLSYAFR